MALISDLVKELAKSTGTAEKSITVIARWLREDGLLSQKGRGRGAAQATPLDAARLLIALMIGGKLSNAPQAVRDFGQLVISPVYLDEKNRTSIERHCGLPSCRTFEEGLAVLIEVWGNGDAMRAMGRYIDGKKPWVLATLRNNYLSGSIQIDDVNAGYSHPHKPRGVKLLDAERPNGGLASWEKLKARYHSGIENQSFVTNELLRPLGEVIADLREPGSMQLRGKRIAKARDEITIDHEKLKRIAKASAVIKEKLERRKRKKAANTTQKEIDALEGEIETEAGWRPDTRVPDGKGGGGDG